MVGGRRSRGCVRCVQRKVACDLVKPVCGHCKRRGETCHIAPQGPKFIFYSSGSRPSAADSATISIRRKTTPPPPPPPHASVPKLPPLPPSPHALRRTLVISSFTQIYSPRANDVRNLCYATHGGQPGRWLSASFQLLQSGRPSLNLETALVSLSLVLVGQASSDQALIRHGRMLYQSLLKTLHAKLKRTQSDNCHDNLRECLLLAYASMKIEYFGNKSLSACLHHNRGVQDLLTFAGTRITRSDHLLYHTISEIRIALIGTHFLTRTPSPLSAPQWLYRAWMPPDPAHQDILQLALDAAFTCLAISTSLPGPAHPPTTLHAHLAHLLSLQSHLSLLISDTPPPPGTYRPSSWSTGRAFWYADHAVGVTRIIGYMIHLMLLSTAVEVHDLLLLLRAEPTPARHEIIARLLPFTGLVLASLEYFWHPGAGVAGQVTALHPYKLAQRCRERYATGENMGAREMREGNEWCEAARRRYCEAGHPEDWGNLLNLELKIK